MKIAIYITTSSTAASNAIRQVLGLSPHVAKQVLELGGVLFECRLPVRGLIRRQVLELLAIIEHYRLEPNIKVVDEGRRISPGEVRSALQ